MCKKYLRRPLCHGLPMTRADFRSELLARVAERFPDQPGIVFRLALKDQEFLALCEEYNLARESYGRLQVSPDHASEVAEYRSLIVELEDEIRGYLQSGREGK